MGYYIQVPSNHDKAELIVQKEVAYKESGYAR